MKILSVFTIYVRFVFSFYFSCCCSCRCVIKWLTHKYTWKEALRSSPRKFPRSIPCMGCSELIKTVILENLLLWSLYRITWSWCILPTDACPLHSVKRLHCMALFAKGDCDGFSCRRKYFHVWVHEVRFCVVILCMWS